MPQAKLSPDVKIFIVQALACFDAPSVVAKAVKAEFGIDVQRQTIEGYDPTKAAGGKLAKGLVAAFHAARDAFLTDMGRIAISHRAVRWRSLQRIAERAESMQNFDMALRALEQAAKEAGGWYTNRRELTGKDGKDLNLGPSIVEIVAARADGYTPDEIEQLDAIEEARSRRMTAGASVVFRIPDNGRDRPH